MTVPARFARWSAGGGLLIGVTAGLFFGVLAVLDSGIPVVFIVAGTFLGVWTTRRMDRYWPGARERSHGERVTEVRRADVNCC
nr:hypothetical protein [Mycolicibacterium malmesburyense]CRL71780.1 hypothetical protein CPGR_02080 [Mycolicibacterium malmesburyense]